MAQTICGWWILWGRRESLVGERWTWRTGKSLGEYCELVGFYYHRSIKAEDEKYYDRIMNEFDIFWAQRQRSTSVNILKQKINVTNRISRKWTIERSYVVLVLTRFKQCILWWTQLLILQLSWVECVRSSRWPWPTAVQLSPRYLSAVNDLHAVNEYAQCAYALCSSVHRTVNKQTNSTKILHMAMRRSKPI